MKRAIFPLLIFFLIAAALVYRLSSCSTKIDSGVTATAGASSAAASAGVSTAVIPSGGVSPSASATFTKPSAHPDVPYTNDDIVKLYQQKGFEVKEIRDAGSHTIVQYYFPLGVGESLSNFAWFDRETGVQDDAAGGLAVDKYVISPEKTLSVLTTGIDYVSGLQQFPEVFTSSFTHTAGALEALRCTGSTDLYFMPIDRGYTVSDDRPESLRSITFDYDSVSVGFGPQPGHEGDFEGTFRCIPRTSVSSSNGLLYVTFYNTTPASGFKAPKAGAGDKLRSFDSIKCDGANTVLTLQLGERADRYNVSMAYSPDDGMPYAVFKFRNDDSICPEYPKGW